MGESFDLDPLIHAPKRMQIMAMLYVATSIDFSFLQEELEVSASVLSKHMSALADAGYVVVKKTGHGRSGLTSFKLTPTGRCAYENYRRIVSDLLKL